MRGTEDDPTFVADGPVIAVGGAVEARSAATLRRALLDRLDRWDHVVVDLGGTTSLDLVALRVLVAASRQAGRQDRSVTLRRCPGPALRLLHLSGLRRLVEVETDPATCEVLHSHATVTRQ